LNQKAKFSLIIARQAVCMLDMTLKVFGLICKYRPKYDIKT